MEHVNYPHAPGYLYDCPACESECHCTPNASECVWSGHDDGMPSRSWWWGGTLRDIADMIDGRIVDTGGGVGAVHFQRDGLDFLASYDDVTYALVITFEDGTDQRDWVTVQSYDSLADACAHARIAPII